MTTSRLRCIAEPAIDAVWRWLLACPAATPAHEVRRRAGLARLDTGRRRVADHALGLLTRRALRRGPPNRLALAGLGELAARSTCDIEPLLVHALRTRRARPPGSALVTLNGIRAEPDEDREGRWRAISHEQLMAGTTLVARQSGSESPTIRIRIRDCDVAIVFLLFVAGKRYV